MRIVSKGLIINNLIQNGSSHGLKQALSGGVYAGVYVKYPFIDLNMDFRRFTLNFYVEVYVKHANLDLYIDFYVNQEQFDDL